MKYFIYKYAKYLRLITVLFFVVFNVFFFSHAAAALDLAGPLKDAGTGLGQTADQNSLPTQIGSIIQIVLSLLGFSEAEMVEIEAAIPAAERLLDGAKELEPHISKLYPDLVAVIPAAKVVLAYIRKE